MSRALPILLAGLLVTSGCLGVFGPDRPPSDDRAVEMVDASRAATAEIDGYRFSIRGQVESADGNERSVSLAGAGRVDVRAERLNATTRTADVTRGVYLDDGMRYTECARMGWGRENLSTSTPWLDYTPLGRQLALLDATNVYWNGTKNGVGIVSAHPTRKELRTADREDGGRAVVAVGGGNVESATTHARFDAEADRLQRVRHRIQVERGDETATATVTIRFDYGPVEVTRPSFDPEAVWQLGCPGS